MTEDKELCNNILGIDIGSVSLSVVRLDCTGNILDHHYLFHKGNVREALATIQGKLELSSVRAIACTRGRGYQYRGCRVYDPQVSVIAAGNKFHKDVRSILVVGAERFSLIKLDRTGNYQLTRTNTSCAAGTGSFLDQQAFRLDFPGIEAFCETALSNRSDIPEIASRCSVFAKTDLIHAQQRGYSLEAICDGLCKGLAKNIVDTLFNKEAPSSPILFVGGVSRNIAVKKHLEEQLNCTLIHDEHSHLYGAIGAGLSLLDEEIKESTLPIQSLEEILPPEEELEYFHEPIELQKVAYPDFSSKSQYKHLPAHSGHSHNIEVDLYVDFSGNQTVSAFMGIDIGSTSTKAILTDENNIPLAGLYTYTAGKPLSAVKAIFESIEELSKDKGISFIFKGVGTTGSGRKFIGKIIGADRDFDEITSHARAAFELNPNTDTIIEIGGQDSKFTLMQDGMVTFSQMNTVCAAGTGSFIEEQAKKLGVTLSEYSEKAQGVGAPLASDRCTVFMERDINQLLNQGYTVNELLSTVLFSVAENYLKKVASEGSIGDHICYQGATAKNRALVAAFEQRLGKSIYVSKYCHLTGALGVALLLQEEGVKTTGFRGLSLYKEDIPIRSETCQLCSNHCHISLATVRDETVAYGFLCGRDYDTKKFVKINAGFQLLEERKKAIRRSRVVKKKGAIKIGLPASLHIFEELTLWERFFSNLSIETITSEHFNEPVKTGKRLAGAEFCAPINAFYGHVVHLAEKTDYIFIPVYLEAREKPENRERNFCYYTQFSASLAYTLKDKGINKKCLTPFLDDSKGLATVSRKLHEYLSPTIPGLTLPKVRKAYEEAIHFNATQKQKLVDLFRHHFTTEEKLSVVLLGRPYVVLSKSLNKGIPDIFSGMGVDTYFQDMIPAEDQVAGDSYLLQKVPWYYAANILETATTVAARKNLYPVLITAFKCAPDSFMIEYFKKIMNEYKKPYLILQIDEHDSNVGYETRIEAALRSFRNHASRYSHSPSPEKTVILPHVDTKINGKTLLMPSWDSLVAPLVVANLKRIGIDARVMESSQMIIKKSMVHNTGQCLPLNIIIQEFIEYIEKYNLKPENTMLWMMESKLSCNLRQYPYYMKNLLESYGKGMEKAAVYSGKLTHIEISYKATFNAYFAYMLGGLIRSVGCKMRPYETEKGTTDKAIRNSIPILEKAFLGERSMDRAVAEAMELFNTINVRDGSRPKVGIFGDFYVRDNDIMNQDLIHAIEDAGGEVISTPYVDYAKITFDNVLRRAISRGDYLEAGIYRVLLNVLKLVDEKYYRYFRTFLGERPVIDPRRLEKNLKLFNINPFHSGESYDNILKIFYIIENHPDVSLFVQTNPAFCCPSLVTEAMTQEIKRITGIPVVTLTYDGTNEYKNDVIVPYLQGTDNS